MTSHMTCYSDRMDLSTTDTPASIHIYRDGFGVCVVPMYQISAKLQKQRLQSTDIAKLPKAFAISNAADTTANIRKHGV